MGRNSSFDDYTGPQRRERTDGSSKLLIVIIMLSVLVCAVAVLIWLTFQENGTETTQTDTARTEQETYRSGPVPAVSDIRMPVAAPGADSTGSLNTGTADATDTNVTSADTAGTEAAVIEEEPYTDEGRVPSVAVSLDSVAKLRAESANPVGYTQHTVQSGETLVSIAELYGLNPRTLAAVNEITRSLSPGTVLAIPDRDGTVYTVQEGDTLSSIVQRFGLSISWRTLKELNGITADSIEAGQKIFIPAVHEAPAESASAEAEPEKDFIMPVENSRIAALYNQRVINPYTGTYMDLDGVVLQTDGASYVKASADGSVVDLNFDAETATFSVKLSHEGGYTTTYSYLSSVNVNISGKVMQGSVIGSLEENNTPLGVPSMLFRIELEGIPLNPALFW